MCQTKWCKSSSSLPGIVKRMGMELNLNVIPGVMVVKVMINLDH